MIHLRPELAARLGAGDPSAVIASLQSAIELEHSTIPPYLYALYSLAPGANREVADILESVVVEEMLHLTLAANVLNALGGNPVLDSPDVVPTYPGPLPGSVEGGLTVGLYPCSISLVQDTFMAIEQPEDPLDFPVQAVAGPQPLTIGQFYRAIGDAIVALGDGAFAPGPRNQVGPDRMDESVVVTDVATACRAIGTITDQGEGTRTSPLEAVGGGYAHYYRFAEIVHGRLLVPNPDAGPDTPPDDRYAYGGDTVTFDPTGVLLVPPNPSTAGYPAGSLAREACVGFNYTYTNLLKTLHATVNGAPATLDAAIGLMMSLEQQAKDMATGAITGGEPVGPSFEWQPVNG
ncbi:MAG: ferritin-like protein [Acidimicrobiales bacterium]